MIGCLLGEVGAASPCKPNVAWLLPGLPTTGEKAASRTAFARHCQGDHIIYHPNEDTFEREGALLIITLGQQEQTRNVPGQGAIWSPSSLCQDPPGLSR